MKRICIITLSILFFTESHASTLYVALDGSSTSPYDTWAKAATQLQVAIDAAAPGDTVLVTNGVYNTGGRPCYGSLTNRCVVTNNITLLSVNGPAYTTIEGLGAAGTTNLGRDAIRCAFISNGIISGFTLSNGHTFVNSSTSDDLDRRGGGLIMYGNAMASNLVVTHCSCGGNWGGGGGIASYSSNWVKNSIIQHCSVTGIYSATATGGGFYLGNYRAVVVKHCFSQSGGSAGFLPGKLVDSLIISNFYLTNVFMQYYGGAICLSSHADVSNCVVSYNRMEAGGGFMLRGSNIHIRSSRITHNTSVGGNGGGICAFDSTRSSFLVNCLLSHNTSGGSVGGAVYANPLIASSLSLVNCTVYSNASTYNAAVSYVSLSNCIVWGNSVSNVSVGTNNNVSYCLTTPSVGVGCVTNDPLFVNAKAEDFHLRSKAGAWVDASNSWVTFTEQSPAIDAGHPDSLWENEAEPNGGRVNIGLYGNTPFSSKSWDESSTAQAVNKSLFVLDSLLSEAR